MNFTMAGIQQTETAKSHGQEFTINSTIHWPTTDQRLKPSLDRFPNHPYVAMSHHQINELTGKKIVGMAPPGVEIEQWPYTPGGEYLLFVGKITPEKGPDLAIQAALKTGMTLIIAGRIIKERHPEYFETYIKVK